MKDYLISLYLDNELDLNEKQEFVDAVAAAPGFYEETVVLLNQEKLLRATMKHKAPTALCSPQRKGSARYGFSLHPALAGLVIMVFLLVTVFSLHQPPAPVDIADATHRFVLYLPDVQAASVVGSFTGWSPVPMERVGNSGYWSLQLKLQPGEHRYSYLIGNDALIADPTIQLREYDDFGGENSIIHIGTTI